MNGVETCFKNINRCDQHPVCDPKEDTDVIAEDEVNCFDDYLKKGLVLEGATHQCQSVHHNEDTVKANLSLGIVWVWAVPCDQTSTCWKRTDENFCDNYLLTIVIPGKLYPGILMQMPEFFFRFCIKSYKCQT